MEDKDRFPRLRLRLMLAPGRWIGPGKADLLEGIAETGSIAAAGRKMGMSYKRAWGLVEEMNGLFTAPLVSAARGGAGHGGAALTEAGHEVLAIYRRLVGAAAAAGRADLDRIAGLRSDMSDRK
jgi:molybdate transport system regulatory protein